MLLRLLSDSPPAALLPVDVVLERHRRVGQVHFVRIMGRVAILNAVAYMLAARRRRREHVAATEFKAKVAPYLVEAPEL